MKLPAAALPPRLRTALDGGTATDDIAEAVLAVPLGVVEVAIRTPTESAWADGLFGTAGFVLAASDAEGGLMTGVMPALPLQIATLVALGPRPLADDDEVAVGDFGEIDDALTATGLSGGVSAVLRAPGVIREPRRRTCRSSSTSCWRSRGWTRWR